MSCGLERTGQNVGMICLKVLSQTSTEGTDENHRKPQGSPLAKT